MVVTRAAFDAKRADFDSSSALWGLIRSARLELPKVTIKTVDVQESATAKEVRDLVTAELRAPASDLEVVHSATGRLTPRMTTAPNTAATMQRRDAMLDASTLVGGPVVVTGGLGGLGLVAAREVAELGAPSLVLTSRSGKVPGGQGLEDRLKWLEEVPTTELHIRKCDAGSKEAVDSFVSEVSSSVAKPIGIIHAAGVLDKCPLNELTADRLQQVIAPKASGAWYLHSSTKEMEPSLFVLFSSISATTGLAGGASYSAANATLDALANWRRERLGGMSVKWGPVSDVGLTASSGQADHLELMPLKALSPAQVASAFRLVLSYQGPAAFPYAEVTLARANWAAFMSGLDADIPQLRGFDEEDAVAAKGAGGKGAALAAMPIEERQKAVMESIRSAASGMGLELEDDTPLMEAGIDSLSAVEFRNKVSTEFREVKLPSTLMFDYPSLAALTDYVTTQLAGVTAAPATQVVPASKAASGASEHMAVLGVGVRLPGGTDSLQGFAQMLAIGVDGLIDVPHDRWDSAEYYDPDATTGLKMYVHHGGFVEGAELFDAGKFSITKPEAECMDPQQRHLLETSYTAFVSAGFTKGELMGMLGAVFVGQDKCDWNRMLTGVHGGPFAATGGSSSISSNRINYVMGLKGPSATIDTACSSSLVAADTACTTLRRRRANVAAVCGVNMCLLPQTFVACCQARMLSAYGRCRTFDATAAGYARGEGCGAQVIERVDRRAAHVEIRGSALNQDGKSSNLTSPNGPSQQAVVLTALTEAKVDPMMLDGLETHGTGTELGDPIEVGALNAVLGGSSRKQALFLGAVKANVGHLEGGAGMAGLLKLTSVLKQRAAAPNLHLRVLNTHIYEDTREFAMRMPTEVMRISRTEAATSVSSFGFGGTNGNVLVHTAQNLQLGRAATVEFNRQSFPWRQATHPLLRRKTTRQDGATVYSSHIEGHVLDLLSHHIVHGEVVVPGACYLEMIVAGLGDFVGKDEAWCVESLGFAKPLVLRLADGKLEEPTELRLVVATDNQVTVESEVGADPEESTLSTHVEATLVRQPGGWPSARPLQQDGFDLPGLRTKCQDSVDIDMMYSFGRGSGLPLQARFRTVRHVQRGDRCSFARLEMERDGTEKGFYLGPSLIDGSFQASMALADADVGIGTLKIPLSIRRLQPMGRTYSIAVWSYFELIDFTDRSTVFRSWLLNDAGEALLYFDHVHLQEVRDEHIQKVLAASGREGAEQSAVYSVEWRDLELSKDAPAQNALVLGTSKAVALLGMAEGPTCHCVAHSKAVNLMDAQVMASVLREKSYDTVVFAGGLAEDETDIDVLSMALNLTQAIVADMSSVPMLVIVTQGTQVLATESLEERKAGSAKHSGLWGFARSIRMEYPGAVQVCTFDASSRATRDVPSAASATIAALKSANEDEVACGDEFVRMSRLTRSPTKVRGPIRLNMPARGALTNLKAVPQVNRRPVIPGFVQLRIRAVGLNFRDVLNVMGLYPGDPGPPGADCSGTVLELGERVNHLRVGEDIFGECPGCLSTFHTGLAALMTQKPASWSFEEASTMPVIFVTVEESLGDLAQLKKGERVLIHAAAGGVGLVAIQYAQWIGAEVYATAGSEEKHAFLRELGVKYITSTRDGQKFETDMKKFLADAGVDGIDVVINSLSHDDYIPRSLALLRKGGRFMEIGKRGIWSHEQMKEARPDVMYEKIAADTMMEKESWRYNGYLKRLLERVDQGGLKPINMHLFDGFERGVAALQFLQRANNIGKVVISEPSRALCTPDAMPVLSGGMGALGLVTAQFVVEEGAKSVCLLSRSGKPSGDAQRWWDWLKASAVTIHAPKCDVSEVKAAKELKKAMGDAKMTSLYHLAGVLADGMLPGLNREALEKSYGPKVHGLYNLVEHVLDPSAACVLFSSTSSLFGSPGQANYAAANSVLDSLAGLWNAQGSHKAWAIQWGPWAEVGMATQANTLKRAKATGVGAITLAQGMTVMSSVLAGAQPLAGAAHIRWAKYLKMVYQDVPKFLGDFEAEVRKNATAVADTSGGSGGTNFAGMSVEQRLVAVTDAITSFAREVVDDSSLEADAPLLESGMDSLSGVEFRNRLVSAFDGVKLPNSVVFDHPTVHALAAFVNGQLGDASAEDSSAQPAAGASQAPVAPMLEQLNDRSLGPKVFLVPGAGMQAGGFRAFANLLPVPAYGLSWPRGISPREEWPSTLTALAQTFLAEIKKEQSSGPYVLLGHSFGCSVALELARLLEASGETVSLLGLMEPRHLTPLVADVETAFASTGLVDSLALLSQVAADGRHFAEQLEVVCREDGPAAQEKAVRRVLNPATLGALEHVHETSQWYSTLLQRGSTEAPQQTLKCAAFILHAEETWLHEPSSTEGVAQKMVRAVQSATFQTDKQVQERAPSFFSGKPSMVKAPGSHFTMLHEPNVLGVALRCMTELQLSQAVG